MEEPRRFGSITALRGRGQHRCQGNSSCSSKWRFTCSLLGSKAIQRSLGRGRKAPWNQKLEPFCSAVEPGREPRSAHKNLEPDQRQFLISTNAWVLSRRDASLRPYRQLGRRRARREVLLSEMCKELRIGGKPGRCFRVSAATAAAKNIELSAAGTDGALVDPMKLFAKICETW